MTNADEEHSSRRNPAPLTPVPLEELDLSTIPSPALARLIEEVRTETQGEFETALYNRIHNRHNRSSPGPWPKAPFQKGR